MKKFWLIISIVAAANSLSAQTFSKEDKKVTEGLKKSIGYLADDKLEGRRTGTTGEKLAAEFISTSFKKSGLTPAGDANGYTQAFEVNDGKELKEGNFFNIKSEKFVLNDDYFPTPFSATGTADFAKTPAAEKAYLIRIDDLLNDNRDNPHFDAREGLLEKIKSFEKYGANIIFISNGDSKEDELTFDVKDKTGAISVPVIYLTKTGFKKYLNNESNLPGLSYNIAIGPKTRTGHNVVGLLNNNASQTIVIGAHYDHLGYGEDHNSLFTGKTPMIHNGADDNASGTAALIELSKWVKNSAPKKFNYLFVAFSGEELGLYGSKYLTEHSPVDLTSVNYMINMDMIGRLNDSTHGLTVGGYGTSPAWSELIKDDGYFKIKIDSAGSGPSDHTSFYKKDIPVLFFFTGTHSDYHKPSDDADKINYDGELMVINYIKKIIIASGDKDKLAFTKTREASMGKSSFKVSLGIMPDYTFSGEGVLVDGVTEGRAAQKAGIKTGDVLLQLGEHSFSDVMTYMGALNKFNKGDATTVKLKRGNEELTLQIVFQ